MQLKNLLIKKAMKVFLLFFLSCFNLSILFAQVTSEAKRNNRQCVSKKEMDSLFTRIKANRPNLVRQGKLKPSNAGINQNLINSPHAFIWPLIAAPNYYQPGFYYISNYVDLDATSTGGDTSSLRDYNCGYRTYDTEPDDDNPSGYDHSGIDIGIGPFGWKMMDDNNVYVVAVENGTIVEKHTGEFSRTCETGGQAATYYGNYIAIEHSDETITFYMHMKNGTLTNKNTGDTILAGEYLGVVASSGNSSGPHLHFEVRNQYDGVEDPFQNGPCNETTYVGSLWANEEPYYNKKILSVFTLSAPWTPASCDTSGVSNGTSEIVPYKNHFNALDPVFFSAAVRDIQLNNTVRLRVYKPDGSEISDYTYTYNGTFNEMKLVPIQLLLAPGDLGTYRLLCTYNGVSYPHFFTVGCPGSQTLSGNRASNSGVISGGSINSTENILSTSLNVQYQAETFIQLNPGFIAEAGCGFSGRIDACTIGGQRAIAVQQKNK